MEALLTPPYRPFFLICLAIVLAYDNVWLNDFVYDDNYIIIANSFLKSWHWQMLTSLTTAGFGGSAQSGFYRPVSLLVHFLVYQIFGPSPLGFHALNIALQALNACLLYRFGIKASFNKGVSLAAALLWAVHPLFTSNITYMSSTPELLQGTFVLLGLTVLLPDFKPRQIGQAAAFYLLAVGAKENAVVFPALAAVTFFYASADRTKPAAYLKLWPLWVMAAVYVAAWLAFIHHTGYNLDKTNDSAFAQDYTHNLLNRIITCLATLPVYAKMIFWPSSLCLERVFPYFTSLWGGLPLLGLLMAIAGAVQIIRGRASRGLALSFGLLWFAIALSPVSNIAIVADARLTEGWMYLPTMGLFLGALQAAADIAKSCKKFLPVFVAVAVLALAATTFNQNKVWRNDDTLYEDTFEQGGHIERVGYDAASYDIRTHHYDRALDILQYLITHSAGAPPLWRADIYTKIATAVLKVNMNQDNTPSIDELIHSLHAADAKQIDEATGAFAKASEENPMASQPHISLAAIYLFKGNKKMADFHMKQARLLQNQMQ